MLNKISTKLNKIILAICMVLVLVMTCIIWVQVTGRYVFNAAPRWSEELARFLMAWLAMLGASVMVFENKNVSVDFFTKKLPPRVQKGLAVFLRLMTFFVFFLMIKYGFKYSMKAIKSISPATGISMAIPYLAVPVGGILMAFQSITVLIKEIKNTDYTKKRVE